MLRMIVVAAAICVAGYLAFRGPSHEIRNAPLTDIGELTKNADRFDGTSVTVKGAVVDATGIYGRGEYRVRQLGDGAEIMVVTDTGVPPVNSVVAVHGVVKQALVFRNRQYAILIEDDRAVAPYQ